MQGKLSKLASIGIRYPIMQAGMPDVANVRLAAAVSRAGAIGTLGLQEVSVWEDRLKETVALAQGKPINANLLLPFTRQKHIDAVIRQQVPIVTLFWGDGRKLVPRFHEHGIFVFQQVGSRDEAARALDAGVDALIVQGSEAGGHVRGIRKLNELLPEVVALSSEVPLFAAGGIYTADDVRRVVASGACGVSTGTRFLLTEESNAHAAYKQRLIEADKTIVTRLFGLGWPALHRVVPNRATARWCRTDGAIPWWLRLLNSSFGFTRKIVPFNPGAAAIQRPGIPFFSASGHVAQLPAALVDATALYAGEHIGAINKIISAEAAVQELARGFDGFGLLKPRL